ncbi:MAG: TIGR04282 family arsenosugar biosynthesis glycosyltransferase [Thermodesulfovibrionales bacterium]
MVDSCILIFVKLPEKGSVKTRLAKDLDHGLVQTLYRNFVLDMLETLAKANLPIIVYFYPPESANAISKWLGKNYTYAPQKGVDLGDRMKNAFRETFAKGFTKAVILGSDLPDLQKNILDMAFKALHVNDVVIGPSADGGYYLIGFRHNSFLPEAFKGISWGTDTVLKDTLKILREKNYRAHFLPELRDVDTIEDLKALYERNKDTAFANSRTMKFISNNLKK